MAETTTLQTDTEKVRALLAAAQDFVIDSQALYSFADAEVAAISEIEKALEARRVKEKQPHLEAGRAVDAAYKPALDFCNQAKNIYRSKMASFYQQQQAEAARAAAQQVADVDPQNPFAVAATPAPVSLPAGTHTHARTRWVIEVADIKAYLRAALKKPELLQRVSIDTSDLQGLATRSQGAAVLPPGLVARAEVSIAGNGGRRSAAT